MIEKLDSAVNSDNYFVFDDPECAFVTFFINDIGLNSVSLFNINLDNESSDYCYPETINHVKLMGWYNRFKQSKAINFFGPKYRNAPTKFLQTFP